MRLPAASHARLKVIDSLRTKPAAFLQPLGPHTCLPPGSSRFLICRSNRTRLYQRLNCRGQKWFSLTAAMVGFLSTGSSGRNDDASASRLLRPNDALKRRAIYIDEQNANRVRCLWGDPGTCKKVHRKQCRGLTITGPCGQILGRSDRKVSDALQERITRLGRG